MGHPLWLPLRAPPSFPTPPERLPELSTRKKEQNQSPAPATSTRIWQNPGNIWVQPLQVLAHFLTFSAFSASVPHRFRPPRPATPPVTPAAPSTPAPAARPEPMEPNPRSPEPVERSGLPWQDGHMDQNLRSGGFQFLTHTHMGLFWRT